jgi:hypothetical protein
VLCAGAADNATQMLESLAGFPSDSSSSTTIAPVQWEEFVGELTSILQLLQHIAGVSGLAKPPCLSAWRRHLQLFTEHMWNEVYV